MSTTETESAYPCVPEDELELLLELLTTGAPSGFESAASEVWRAAAEAKGAHVRVDAIGNTFATVNPGAARRVAIIGHLDEIGLIVTRIDDKGFLRCGSIGGWDVSVLVGQRVQILTDGGVVIGSIARPAVHVLDAAEKQKVPKLTSLWIDIGATSGDEARSRVRVGDPIVLDVDPVRLSPQRLMSRSLDNRVGAFIALQAAIACAGTDVEVTAVGSICEEIGGLGAQTAAYGLQPETAIVVDVTTPGDTPSSGDAGDFSLGKGPIVTRGATTTGHVVDRLIEVAERSSIPVQVRGLGRRTRTDADSVVRAGAGVPVGLVSVPGRYLHSPCEQVDLRDVQASIDLIAAWITDDGGAT